MQDYLKGAEYTSKIEFTDNTFPKLFIFQNQPTNLGQFSNSVSLNMRFLDVAEGVNNKQRRDYEIKSDMQLAASVLFDLMQREDIILTTADISLQPIYVTGGDGLSGVEANVTIPLSRPCTNPLEDFSVNSASYTIPIGGSQAVNIGDVSTGSNLTFAGAVTSGDIAITFNEAKTIMTLTSDGASGVYIVNFSVTNGRKIKSDVIAVNVLAASASGIQYASYESLWSGQSTSYIIGDEGWRFQQGEFDSYVNPNPEAYATLDLNAIDPYTTLLNDNIFGNKNRFTAPDGTQNYQTFTLNGATLAIIIDHFYGMAIASRLGTLASNYQDTLLQAIADAPSINEQGFSGFSVAAIGEVKALTYNDLRRLPQPMDDNSIYSSCSPSLQIANPFYVLYTVPSDGRILWAGNRTQNSLGSYFFVKNIQSILQP